MTISHLIEIQRENDLAKGRLPSPLDHAQDEVPLTSMCRKSDDRVTARRESQRAAGTMGCDGDVEKQLLTDNGDCLSPPQENAIHRWSL